jgi:hypothetical protein
MIMHNTHLVVTITLLLVAGSCSAQIVDLSSPGETVADAVKEAQEAVANSTMKISINTVGFDLYAGSEAENYLQEIAQIGGGSYFAAADGGQLTQAMTGAATGQISGYGGTPIITSPQNADTVGPATMVTGTAQIAGEGVIVIQTEVYDQLNGDFIKMVPGHRHKLNPDGSFALLIATPLVSFGVKRPLRYEIHAFTATSDGNKSAHAIVTVDQQQPTP